MKQRSYGNLREEILSNPVVATAGNHSARLVRILDDVVSAARSEAERMNIMASRVGVFARSLAEDIAEGSVAPSQAVLLLNWLGDIGDGAFDGWLSESAPSGIGPKERATASLLPLRKSLCEPIPAIFSVAAMLQAAVDLHNVGDRDGAQALLRKADDPGVRAFTETGWGKGAAARYGFLQLADAPPFLPKDVRPVPRMPTVATQAEVLGRDGHHCRFCGIPVVSSSVRKRIHAEYPEAVGWGPTNSSQHAAFQCMWLQFDHLLPNSRGGDSSASNIVVTCAVCNFGRMQATLEEARLMNPLTQPVPELRPRLQNWAGLQTFRSY